MIYNFLYILQQIISSCYCIFSSKLYEKNIILFIIGKTCMQIFIICIYVIEWRYVIELDIINQYTV